MSLLVMLVLVCVVILLVLVLAWWLAGRMKRSYEADPAGRLVARQLRVSPQCVQRLGELSREPVLLKLEDGVLWFQVDDLRMAPVAVAPGSAVGALREAGAAASTEFGEAWVVLVRPTPPDKLVVHRLS